MSRSLKKGPFVDAKLAKKVAALKVGDRTVIKTWARSGKRGICEFGGLDNPGDERRWQGRPHDLKAFDEVTEQREDRRSTRLNSSHRSISYAVFCL